MLSLAKTPSEKNSVRARLKQHITNGRLQVTNAVRQLCELSFGNNNTNNNNKYPKKHVMNN
jgi:hypothetical protein